MENKLQNLKFRVYSEAHSKAIQEMLFELNKNIMWNGIYEQKIITGYISHLFLNCNKIAKLIDNNESYFEKDSSKLCTLDDLYKMQAEPKPQSELMTKLEIIQKELDSVKEEISKLNK